MANEVTLIDWFDDRFYRIDKRNEKGDIVSTDYFPSVTTKLGVVDKPFLAKWRGDIGNREADMRLFEAQERGTRIHAAWEVLSLGGAVVFNPPRRPIYIPEKIAELREKYNGFLEVMKYQEEHLQILKLSNFLDIVKPKILASEIIVYSETYREAGTVDNVMEIAEGDYQVNGRTKLHISGGVYIVDLKTGKSLDDNAYMQTAAYKNAYEELGRGTVAGTMILHTGSTNKTGIPGLGVALRTAKEAEQDFKDFRAVSTLWERKNADSKPTTFEFPSLITMRGK